MCTRMLADAGAEVVKVEPPDGDVVRQRPPQRGGVSTYYASMNCGKKSIVLDLQTEDGKRLATRAGGAGRRRGRELPPGRDEAPRPRLRDPVARQPAPRLRLDLRLRPDRADGLGAGLRAGDPCRVGLRARLQPVPARRRPAGEQRHLHRRRDGRLVRLRRDPARPLRAREERPRPAHRRLADGLGARHADLRDAGGAVPARAAAPGLRAGARQRRLRDGRGGDAEEPRGAVRDHRLSRRQDRPALRHHGDQGGELAGAAGADRALDLAAHAAPSASRSS